MSMCSDLIIKFKNIGELHIEFLDLPFIENFVKLCNKHYVYQKPIVRDYKNYDIELLKKLANQSKDLLGWNWIKTDDQYNDLAVTTQLHKDLEKFLSNGYNNIPDGYDQLLHDLHVSLHSAQGHHSQSSIQLEWFDDDGFPLNDHDLEFINDNTLGAVMLQNPYVGHPPSWVYGQNDHTNVWQTCRFHDFVRPGIVIKLTGNIEKTVVPYSKKQQDNYIKWFQDVAPDFLAHHGNEKMLRNQGSPIIGYVTNNQLLLELKKQNSIEFEYLSFDSKFQLDNTFDPLIAIKKNITKDDYDRMSGDAWPSYNDFMNNHDVPDFVLEELARMIDSDLD